MRIRSLLAIGLVIAPPVAAQSPAPAAPSPVVQEYLSVPAWYLSYRIMVESHAPASPAEGRGSSIDLQRVTTGSVQLGIRSSGPSLSLVMGKVPTSPQAFIDIIDLFANWIGGAATDETKSEAEQDAEFNRVLEANRQAFERYSSVVQSGSGAGSSRTTRSGSAPVISLADFHFEIDARTKTYVFKFASGFADSEQSTTAVRGESISHLGTTSEHRLAIVTSLNAGTEQVASIEGPGSFIEGKLPESFGTISGSLSYRVRLVRGDSAGYPGTMVIQYTLSPHPPEEVELVIIPPDHYEQWRPQGGEDEATPGDFLSVKVRLQKRDGSLPKLKASRFKYRLENTSREKGVCMNWPLRAATNQPPDLQFEGSRNPAHGLDDAEGLAASRDGAQLTDDTVIISCFDYGPRGQLVAEAQLEDGRIIRGTVQGSQLDYLDLPKHVVGSRIATVFLDDHGVSGLADDDDGENDPVGDGFKGDGLTLYEEYRGFHHDGEWMPCDPKVKDFFVLNQMRGMAPVLRGIGLFESVSRLNVHQLLKNTEVNDAMVINFNYTDAPHVVDQHVIRILRSYGIRRPSAAGFVEEVGTPETARAVRIVPNLPEFRTIGARTYEDFAATLAHEMLHACNVYHHGEADKVVTWELRPNPAPHVVEVEDGRETPIIVQLENGTGIVPTDLFATYSHDGQSPFNVKLGVPHGQHSGADDCLMRYDDSWGYESLANPAVRYLLPQGEIPGTTLCKATAGTGVNAPGYRPQSRYDSAATPANGNSPKVKANRGNCEAQLRVNDLGNEPKR